MRGIYSNKTEIRHKVFTEIARMAYDDSPLSRIEDLPYEIVPGEIGKYYDNIFLERAIVGERLRATMGLPIRKMRNTTIPHLLTLLSLHAMHVLRNVFLLQTHVRDV